MAGDSAGGREVGRISIRVVPDLKDFRAKLAAELKAIEDSMKATIQVDVDVDADGAKAHMRGLLTELKAMAADDVKVNVDVDGDAFQREATKIASSATSSIGGLGGMGRGLAIVAAVAAFAAPALALISGVLVSLPAIIASVLVPVAAIALGLDGLKEAAKVLGPGFDALKKTMSEKFQDVFTPIFTKLANVFPTLQEAMPGVATALGTVAQAFVDVVTSQSGLDSIKGTIKNISDTITASAPGIGKLTEGLLGLANGVTSKFPAVGKWIDDVGTSFDNWVAKVSTVDASGTSPLDRAMGNLGTTLKGVLDIIGDLATAGFEFLQDPNFGKSMTDFVASVKSLVSDILPGLKSFFMDLAGGLKTITDAIAVIKTFDPKNGTADTSKVNEIAQDDLFKPFTSENAPWRGMLDSLKTAWDATLSWLRTTWGQFTAFFAQQWSVISTAGSQVWDTIRNAATSAISGISSIFTGIPAALSAAWSGLAGIAASAFGSVVNAVSTAFSNAYNAVVQGAGQIVGEVAALPGKISGALGSLGGLLVAAGHAAMDGLLSGIKAGAQAVYDFVSGIAAKIAALKGPISYDKTVLTPNGQALMQGLQDGIEGGLEGVLQRASAIAGQINDAMNNGGTIQVDGLKDQLKKAMDELALESKDLKVQFDAIPKTDKTARQTNQDQRATVQSLRDQLSLQSEQLGFSQKYGDNVKDASTNWGDIGKKLATVGTDFAKATGQQAMSDLGISGNGALTGGLMAGVDWLTQLGTTNIHVNSLDEGLAAKQNITNKRALQYTQR